MASNVYAAVAPFVLLLIAIEFGYCLWKRNGYYSFQDSLMGLGTMFMAQCVNLAVTVAVIASYDWVHRRFALFHFEPRWWHYGLGYVLGDFLFYWFHRAGHRINLFWAAHVPHHSAEELNYAVALRASLTQRAASFLFYWPMAILGFPAAMVLELVAINLVFQLLPHTRVIGRLPRWIEAWLNTPYHHRIHHAKNPVYWDKNYGGTLIVWDRLFGTYADQTEEPYYGVTVHPRSWNPIALNFHWFGVLWGDMIRARTWGDRARVWLKPPGWRPAGLEPYVKDVTWAGDGTQLKYQVADTPALRTYLAAQVLAVFGLLMLLFRNGDRWGAVPQVLLAALVWHSVINWAALLEGKRWAVPSEWVRYAWGACLMWGLLSG